MTGYTIIFILMLLVQLINVKSKKGYKIKIFISYGLLFLYGGFRTSCGDYDSYETYFEGIHSYGLASSLLVNEHMEYGWAVLCSIFPSYRMLVLAHTLFICSIWAYLTYKLIPEKYSWLIILLLYISGDKTVMFMFSGMRNSIAVGCLPLLYFLIVNKRWLMVGVLTVIAASIHNSALIFFPVSGFVIWQACHSSTMTKKELYAWILMLVALNLLPIDTFSGPISLLLEQENLSRYQEVIENQHSSAGYMVTIGSVILSAGVLYYLYKFANTTLEHAIGRLSLLFSYSYLLGSLNYRISQYYVLFFLIVVIFVLCSSMPKAIKYPYLLFVLLFFSFGLFVVEMGNAFNSFELFKSFI